MEINKKSTIHSFCPKSRGDETHHNRVFLQVCRMQSYFYYWDLEFILDNRIIKTCADDYNLLNSSKAQACLLYVWDGDGLCLMKPSETA